MTDESYRIQIHSKGIINSISFFIDVPPYNEHLICAPPDKMSYVLQKKGDEYISITNLITSVSHIFRYKNIISEDENSIIIGMTYLGMPGVIWTIQGERWKLSHGSKIMSELWRKERSNIEVLKERD